MTLTQGHVHNKQSLTCFGLVSWFRPPSSSFFVSRIFLTRPPERKGNSLVTLRQWFFSAMIDTDKTPNDPPFHF